MMDSRFTIEQGAKIMFDFVTHGLAKHDLPSVTEFQPTPLSGEVVDFASQRQILYKNTIPEKLIVKPNMNWKEKKQPKR